MHTPKFFQKLAAFILYVSGVVLMTSQSSCKKYLDVKRNQALAVPSSLKDLQAIIDNQSGNASAPDIIETVAGDFYLSPAVYNVQDVQTRMNYTWDAQAIVPDKNWNDPYKAIYDANFVLDFLPEIKTGNADQAQYNSIKGSAIFNRAFMFHQLAQLFCNPYSDNAATDPGIVIRLTAAVEDRSTRSTVQQTYDQIINDLKMTVELLPAKTTTSFRPNKAAAYALLARVYLSMRDYSNAGTYADLALKENASLLDYNSLTPAGSPQMLKYISNPEIMFVGFSFNPLLEQSRMNIDTFLYRSYDDNDLRKKVFFGTNGTSTYWQGSYIPDDLRYDIFSGLAVDELYLIRAESFARAGNKDAALSDLNTLLRKRWKTGTFADLTAVNANDALKLVIDERRKELLFRGLRWSDLRRFNLESANITLKRSISGNEYTLPPKDLRWTLLIPVKETSLSGIPQNPR